MSKIALRRSKDAQENIEYILRELLEYKDCVSMSNVVSSDGHLYEDIVKDIENYLKKSKDPS